MIHPMKWMVFHRMLAIIFIKHPRAARRIRAIRWRVRIMSKIVFFDLETSGLDKDEHAIVQIGAIAFDVATFTEIERIDIRVKFNFAKASPRALAINGVANRAMEMGGIPPIDEVPDTVKELTDGAFNVFKTMANSWNETAIMPTVAEKQFSQFLKRHATVSKISKAGNLYQVTQLAGHNATDFDMPFLRAWYKRLGKFMPANWFAMDTLTMALANQMIGGIDYADLKLETLLRHHGIAESQTHDALSDVAQTAALCQMLYHRIGFDNEIEADKNEASEKAQQAINGIPADVKKEMKYNAD